MSDGLHDGGFRVGPERAWTRRTARLTRYAGALGSVALIVGLGVWGWQLAVREARGVPVVRAPEGPARVVPDNPGGVTVAHQGLAVNRISGHAGVAEDAESITLAPTPIALAPEDVPGLGAHDEGDAGTVITAGGAPVGATDDAAALAGATTGLADIQEPEDAIAAAISEALAFDMMTEEEVELTTSARTPAPARSPRPRARQAQAAAPAPVEPATIDAESLAPGTRLVQFGAFDDEKLAEAEWRRVQGRFPALIRDKAPLIQQAESGGHVFWRLRAAGFASEDDSRRFCAALEAEGATCIPVTFR